MTPLPVTQTKEEARYLIHRVDGDKYDTGSFAVFSRLFKVETYKRRSEISLFTELMTISTRLCYFLSRGIPRACSSADEITEKCRGPVLEKKVILYSRK